MIKWGINLIITACFAVGLIVGYALTDSWWQVALGIAVAFGVTTGYDVSKHFRSQR